MRRVSYASVLEKALALYLGSATASNTKTDAALRVHIEKHAGECWEAFAWPEWTLTEKRTFRAPWSAVTAYAIGDEVWFEDADAYAVATATSTNQAPYIETSTDVWALNSAYWSDETADEEDILRNIALEQSWEDNAIGEVLGIFCEDPRRNFSAGEVKYVLGPEGAICVSTAPNEVWVRFRQVPPSWPSSAATWAAGTYAEGTTVYQATLGDFYTALESTSEVVTDTTKWERIDFPYVLRFPVAQLAYASALRGDGMNEKASTEEAAGWQSLKREFDKIERQQKQHRGLPVKTRCG